MKLISTIFLLTLFTLCYEKINAANILGVFPSNSKSQFIVHMSIIRALLERGHNVTVVTSLPVPDKNANLHGIYVPMSSKRLQQQARRRSEMISAKWSLELLTSSMNIVLSTGPPQYDVLKHPTFQDFMENPHNKFDLLIVGYFFNDYIFGLGVHFDCPIVISWTGPPNIFVGRHIGNPLQLAYVPATPIMALLNPLKFTERLRNVVTAASSASLVAGMTIQMARFYSELFPSPQYPSMQEAGKRVSLVMCNSHFTDGFVRPNVPALIEIGGVQIKSKPDPLPKDLQEILKGASEHGVIFLSFGADIESNDLTAETIEIIYKTLSSLRQTVLWKWNSKHFPGTSPNIHYRQWLPQDDFLGHPNLKLFITHAGKGSVGESQYYGVPMVAIPLCCDQLVTADQLTRNGYGRQVNVHTMTEVTLRAEILEVLENASYRENVQMFSALYRDRPMTAKETAVYWIEYVIRHNGAYHMQSPLVHLSNLEYLSVDVVAFLFTVMFIGISLLRIVLRFLMTKIWSGRGAKLKTN